MMKRIESFLERLIFGSRWLLAPFYLGLVLALALLLVKFVKTFMKFFVSAFSGESGDVIISVLDLIDVVMIGNLLLIIVFAGYETFVSKIDTAESEDRPSWMGYVGFADLKMKIMGSIVAISGIELLKMFMNLDSYADRQWQLPWLVGLHMTFVVSGVLFAVTERIANGGNKH
jgi:uncharacterized protein (TIGR00645 family)